MAWNRRAIDLDGDRGRLNVCYPKPSSRIALIGAPVLDVLSNWQAEFIDAARQSVTAGPVAGAEPLPDLRRGEYAALLGLIRAECRTQWGPWPCPTDLSRRGDDYVIHLRNNPEDRNPSSVVIGDYRHIKIESSDPEVASRHYYLRASPNEMVRLYAETGSITPPLVQRGSTWAERGYLNPESFTDDPEELSSLRTRFAHTRPARMARAVVSAALSGRLTVILSEEGAGKTTALMRGLLTATHPEDGPVVFAYRSYRQAEENLRKFNARPDLNLGAYRGVLLTSYSHEYDLARGDTPALTPREIVALKASSLLEAIYAQPGPIRDHLDGVRNKYLAEIAPRPGSSIVLFTVHSVVQHWYRWTSTRFWLHECFPEWMEILRAEGAKAASKLGRHMYETSSLGHVVHDELDGHALLSSIAR